MHWARWPLGVLSLQRAQKNSHLLSEVLCRKDIELRGNRQRSRKRKTQKKFPGRDALGKNMHPDGWPCAFSCYNFTQIGTDADRGGRLALGWRCLFITEPDVKRLPRAGWCIKHHRWGPRILHSLFSKQIWLKTTSKRFLGKKNLGEIRSS